jgi:hypothetical protein
MNKVKIYKKVSLIALVSVLSAGFTSAQASPCGVELCLSDFDAAQNVSECSSEINEFFAIIEKKRGKFSPSRTLKKRRDFLYKCESGNNSDKERILAKYGAIYKP